MIRLMHSETLEFEEFEGENVPPYAILSHTWLDSKDEMNYQDMIDGIGQDRPGYAKIRGCGQTAVELGIRYIWADSACIDRRSSAELSEAINSMFNWYREAKICLVYLSDVSAFSFTSPYQEFRNSRWFTRGWTLQELLAPRKITFYSKEWTSIGSKKSHIDLICEITSIHYGALQGTPLSGYSVAQRMSWAAKRHTTRIEDVAYSLMGIFDVNMALLYGERNKAFMRLQGEIIKTSNDQSIFAWKNPRDSHHLNGLIPHPIGLLADSPSCFSGSANIRSRDTLNAGKAFSLTNRGIHIWLQFQDHIWKKKQFYDVFLDCDVEGCHVRTCPVIRLVPSDGTATSHMDFLFKRISSDELPIREHSGLAPDSGYEQVYALHSTPVRYQRMIEEARCRNIASQKPQ